MIFRGESNYLAVLPFALLQLFAGKFLEYRRAEEYVPSLSTIVNSIYNKFRWKNDGRICCCWRRGIRSMFVELFMTFTNRSNTTVPVAH